MGWLGVKYQLTYLLTYIIGVGAYYTVHALVSPWHPQVLGYIPAVVGVCCCKHALALHCDSAGVGVDGKWPTPCLHLPHTVVSLFWVRNYIPAGAVVYYCLHICASHCNLPVLDTHLQVLGCISVYRYMHLTIIFLFWVHTWECGVVLLLAHLCITPSCFWIHTCRYGSVLVDVVFLMHIRRCWGPVYVVDVGVYS